MTFDNAYGKFKLISGLEDKELTKWLPLLKEAILYVESIAIKKDLTDLDELRLENAAAVYAYYRYVSFSSSEHSSFSAGELSVTFNADKVKSAENMWKRELEAISDIASSGFIFKRVT